jgi:chorismate mutase
MQADLQANAIPDAKSDATSIGSSDVPRDLLQLRDSIDLIDQEIIAALARRFAVTEQVGLLKARHDLESVDPVREQTKLQRLRDQAEQHGINPDFVRSLFQQIFDEVVKNHRQLRKLAGKQG